MDYPIYIVHGKNPKTNRNNKRVIYALDKEYAKKEMEEEGFVGPFEITLQQEPPATVKQIDYAISLGIPIPMDATQGEMSRRISAVVDNNVDFSQFHPIVGKGWDGWPSYLHKEESQIRRQARAKSAQCKPSQISTINNAGIFAPSNSDGRYIATLENCHCMDYYRTGKPCKHMYRLAHELGLYDLSLIQEMPTVMRSNTSQPLTAFKIPVWLFHIILFFLTCGIGNLIYLVVTAKKKSS